MTQVTARWNIAPPLSPEAEAALERFPPVLRRVLYHRGYTTYEAARAFLRAEAPPGTEDPFGLLGMETAVERIAYALTRQQPIAVYGDYDADGVTATALLVEALRALGGQVRPYIPNRFDEGYGLNREALTALHDEGVRLVVTVDCGIRSLEEAEHARRLGLDLIVTDHHLPGEVLPQAVAVINPRQPGDPYPEKDLAGVGLAYKLAQALFARLRPAEERMVEAYLDLVALGTVADLAPLRGENRHLVRRGLYRLRQPRRQGVLSLIRVAGLQPERVTATHIGFMLGPRLNAAGRLDSALAALRLLLARTPTEAGPLAMQLDRQNRARQRLTKAVAEAAERLALAEAETTPWVLCAAHPDFNPGVVGLAAARLVERYYRPALVAQRGETFTRGSARSIPEFHITNALEQCADLLEHYGGHAAAAGFTLRNEHWPAFVERLQTLAAAQLGDLDLRPTLQADAEVSLSELTTQLLDALKWLEPTGYGNPRPRFVARGVRVTAARAVGSEGNHLKLMLTDGRITLEGIAFRQGHWAGRLPSRVDVLFVFEWNEYNGRARPQLNIKDLRPAA